jgi:glycosyltransferase involved in cell wall biosynthesis
MKVCHFTSAHLSDDIRIFHKESVSLAAAGFEVYLVASNGTNEERQGVKIVSTASKKRGRLGRMIFTAREVYRKALSIDADIYHFHDPELLRFAIRLKRKGKIVVYDAHEDLPRQIMGKEYLRFKSLVANIVERYENHIARRVNLVVTATPFIAKRFRAINSSTIDINNFPLLTEIDVLEEGIQRNFKRICFIGGISKIRGIIELVEALKGTDIQLDLAGTIPAALLEILEQSEGWRNVRPLGYINRQESLQVKGEVAAGMVTFLPLPNHVNAQPNKIFEYMASGLPVIGSNFPLWKEIIEENECGICVDPMDPTSVRNGIVAVLGDPERARKMGENGKRMVLEKYNWNAEALKLVKVYRQLTDKHA